MANQVVLQFGSIIVALNVFITSFANLLFTHKLLIGISLIYIAHIAISTHYVTRSTHSYIGNYS